MDIARLVLDYLKVLVWPTVVLTAFVVMRTPLTGLVRRLSSAEGFGLKAAFSNEVEELQRAVRNAEDSLAHEAESKSRHASGELWDAPRADPTPATRSQRDRPTADAGVARSRRDRPTADAGEARSRRDDAGQAESEAARGRPERKDKELGSGRFFGDTSAPGELDARASTDTIITAAPRNSILSVPKVPNFGRKSPTTVNASVTSYLQRVISQVLSHVAPQVEISLTTDPEELIRACHRITAATGMTAWGDAATIIVKWDELWRSFGRRLATGQLIRKTLQNAAHETASGIRAIAAHTLQQPGRVDIRHNGELE